MRLGEEWPDKYDLSSLRLLGTVGEPINPEAWMWYHRVIGKERCPIVDTWWQTETGGIMITTLPGRDAGQARLRRQTVLRRASADLKEDGQEAGVDEGGSLMITHAWPGMLRGVYGDPKSELIKRLFLPLPAQVFHRRRLPPRCRWLLLADGAHR
jgi:acetyl-CoA synthetase